MDLGSYRTIYVPQSELRIKPVTKSHYNFSTKRTEFTYTTETVYETRMVPQLVYDPPKINFNLPLYSDHSTSYKKEEEKQDKPQVKPYVYVPPPKRELTPEEKEKEEREEEERRIKREKEEKHKKLLSRIGLISFIVYCVTSISSLIFKLIINADDAILYFLSGLSLLVCLSIHINAFQDTNGLHCCCFYTIYVSIILFFLIGLLWTQSVIEHSLAFGIPYVILEYGSFIVWNYAVFRYRFLYAKTEFEMFNLI